MSDFLYQEWKKLGVEFVSVPVCRTPVDIEKLLTLTAKEGRCDARLIFGMRSWLLENYDLVNAQRLIRFIKEENKNRQQTAVLGAVLESVVKKYPRSSLKAAIKYCQKNKNKEFVFKRVASSQVLSKINEEENHPIWKKWNLVSREMSLMTGVLRKRKIILNNNKNLLLRAFFGIRTSTELLVYFLSGGSGNALEIVKDIGLSYEPVYSELQRFMDLKFIADERKGRGRARVYHLQQHAKTAFQNFLSMMMNPI